MILSRRETRQKQQHALPYIPLDLVTWKSVYSTDMEGERRGQLGDLYLLILKIFFAENVMKDLLRSAFLTKRFPYGLGTFLPQG